MPDNILKEIKNGNLMPYEDIASKLGISMSSLKFSINILMSMGYWRIFPH
jgi:predicted transcriptional regulator